MISYLISLPLGIASFKSRAQTNQSAIMAANVLAHAGLLAASLDAMAPARKRAVARETLDIYAPIANRLGMSKVKNELEELAFKHLETEEYKALAKKVYEQVANSYESARLLDRADLRHR